MKAIADFLTALFYSFNVYKTKHLTAGEFTDLSRKGFAAAIAGDPEHTIISNWKEDCQKAKDESVIKLKNALEESGSELKRLGILEDQDDQQRFHRVKQQHMEDHHNRQVDIKTGQKAIERQIADKNQKRNEKLLAIEDYKLTHSSTPRRKGLFDTSSGLIIIVAGASGFEFLVNYPVFVSLELPDPMILPFSVFTSGVIGMCAHFVGKMHAKRNLFSEISWLAIGVIILGVLTFYRFGTENSPLLSIFCILIFAVAVLLSVYREERRNYWSDMEDVQDLDGQIENDEAQYDRLEAKLSNLEPNLDVQVELLVEEDKKEIADKITEQTRIKEDLEGKIRVAENNFSKKEAEGIDVIKAGYDKGLRSKRGRASRFQNAIRMILVLISLSGFTGCDQIPDSTEIILAFDKTQSMQVQFQDDAGLIGQAVEQSLPFDQNIYNGCVLHFAKFGPSSVPDIITLRLEPVAGMMKRVQKPRLAQIDRFKHQIRDTLDYILASPPLEGNTGLSRSICYFSEVLDRSSAGSRSLWLFTDGLESIVADFENTGYLQRQPPEDIADILSDDCPLKPMSGITVRYIYRSGQDETIHLAQGFWKYYLESHGAIFRSSANSTFQF